MEQTLATTQSFRYTQLVIPLLIIMLLAMMVLPLPSLLLDVFFTFNITLSLMVLLACIYTKRPLDFSVFPTILLVTTLLRLALNVASTRIVLLKGHHGTGAAGKVIESFGEVVIGSSYTVGIVVFAILVIINFVVVTKGAGRVSEVSARFTLDAMPGKQMAIDADLNAGVITQEEAKIRRAEVTEEADFYGAMDGSSKFVRGDAIAGLLILIINLVGGLAVGTLQYDMSFTDAVHNYAILTIGDGLVAQIPSLLLSSATAVIVTRTNTQRDMGKQVSTQLFSDPRTFFITAGIIASLGTIPGMPHIAFLGLACLTAFFGLTLGKNHEEKASNNTAIDTSPRSTPKPTKELDWDDVDDVDMLRLEIGYRLIPLADTDKNGQLMERIKQTVRKKLSQRLGFLLPPIHIRDNLELSPTQYQIRLMGVTIGTANIQPNKELAINPGNVFGTLEGEPCKDPAFGLNAVWIDPSKHEEAQSLGYTIVDPCTVVATHLNHLLQQHAAQLLGHEEVQHLLDKLATHYPKLVEVLTPGALPLSVIVKVLQQLLAEQIPITDMRTIAETLVENAAKSQDSDVLTCAVRVALRRLIVQNYYGDQQEISAATLAPELEQILQQSLQVANDGKHLSVEPGLAERLHKALNEYAEQQRNNNQTALLLVAPNLRPILARFAKNSVNNLHILCYTEIPEEKQIKITSTIGQ